MKLVRYVCTHCGKKFEAEEKEILECPGCFWSTSVKREEDVQPEPVLTPASKRSMRFKFSLAGFPRKAIVITLGVIFATWFLLRALGPIGKSIRTKKPSSEIKMTEQVKPSTAPSAPVEAALTPAEQNILNSRIQISSNREPSEEEKRVLANQAEFKTGFSEKLPSQPWTVENFKEMLVQQEKFFQVPLPRSYKNKLMDHFEAKYLPAAEAFRQGDLIKARNGWVEALAVPLYSNDIQKHRGVVLTMIRPYINDTLSKIGTINSAAAERAIREKEQEIVSRYAKLPETLQGKKWEEALSSLNELLKITQALTQPQKIGTKPMAYPPAVQNVDRDIQATLFEILTVPPPAFSDLEPLLRDIQAKKRVVESFIAEEIQERQVKYDEAMDAIAGKRWADAEQKLKEIDLPLALVQDASEKIKVLKKLNKK